MRDKKEIVQYLMDNRSLSNEFKFQVLSYFPEEERNEILERLDLDPALFARIKGLSDTDGSWPGMEMNEPKIWVNADICVKMAWNSANFRSYPDIASFVEAIKGMMFIVGDPSFEKMSSDHANLFYYKPALIAVCQSIGLDHTKYDDGVWRIWSTDPGCAPIDIEKLGTAYHEAPELSDAEFRLLESLLSSNGAVWSHRGFLSRNTNHMDPVSEEQIYAMVDKKILIKDENVPIEAYEINWPMIRTLCAGVPLDYPYQAVVEEFSMA